MKTLLDMILRGLKTIVVVAAPEVSSIFVVAVLICASQNALFATRQPECFVRFNKAFALSLTLHTMCNSPIVSLCLPATYRRRNKSEEAS